MFRGSFVFCALSLAMLSVGCSDSKGGPWASSEDELRIINGSFLLRSPGAFLMSEQPLQSAPANPSRCDIERFLTLENSPLATATVGARFVGTCPSFVQFLGADATRVYKMQTAVIDDCNGKRYAGAVGTPQGVRTITIDDFRASTCPRVGSAVEFKETGPDTYVGSRFSMFASEAPDGGSSASPAQLNDLSILFPLTTSPSEIDTGYLKVSSVGARGTMMPRALYTGIGPISGSAPSGIAGSTGTAPYENLRIVAMRIDPCFAALSPAANGAGCDNQLRLIAQEIVASDGEVRVSDSALHLFYTLTRAELQSVVRSIVSLREAQAPGEALGSLKPHPTVVKQGLAGAMGKGLRDLILARAGQTNLVRVTALSGGLSTWKFTGWDVVPGAATAFTLMTIPTLPRNAETQTFFSGFGNVPEGSFEPSTTGADNMTALANVNTATALDEAARKAAYDALLRIENPTKSSPQTTDCASCHVTTPMSKLIAGPKFSLSPTGNPNAFVSDPRFVSSVDTTPSFDNEGVLNVHAFSYVDRRAGINQRTVNETAAIVAYVNSNVLR